MSYEKNTWKTGDVITSTKLNHMEDGIANTGDILVIGGFNFVKGQTSYQCTGTADKTWQEIDNALAAGVICIVVGSYMGGHVQLIVSGTMLLDGKYIFYITNGQDDPIFVTTTSADGYPTIDDGGGSQGFDPDDPSSQGSTIDAPPMDDDGQ